MKTLTTGLLGYLLLTSVAQADVFVSVDANGSYVLSNVHRPGRTYERVIHEPAAAVVSLDQQPQMIAGGLMQLMPDTAREMGVKDVYDPKANIQGGAKYLKRLLTLFDNDIALAVAAYNAGPQAVLSRGGVIPPFAETQRYVPDVLRQYRRLQGLAVDAPL